MREAVKKTRYAFFVSKENLKKFFKSPKLVAAFFVWIVLSTSLCLVLFFLLQSAYKNTRIQKQTFNSQLISQQKQVAALKNRDEYKINKDLESKIAQNHDIFNSSISVYENMADLPQTDKKLPDFKTRFAGFLKDVSNNNNSSASAEIRKLSNDVNEESESIVQSIASTQGPNPANAQHSNIPPASGFSRQVVSVNGTDYVVDLVAGDLSTTRVIVDTASSGDCSNNCPVLSLGDYVARNGAYAGVNGSYFCPAEYPSCAGKTNSFDTLLMNKNKVYFNSANNVYSTVPAVIFGNGFVRFVGASEQWGRDTSVDSVIANRPLLVSGGKDIFGGPGEPKENIPSTRGFVANKGNTVYIGVLHNVTVAQGAQVLVAMGMDNAINLDASGSVALWANGSYVVGPGRNLPNVILFVHK